MRSWSLIVFCYNEEESIAGVLKACDRFLHASNDRTGEIILIDDGSTDSTEEICFQLQKDLLEFRIIRIDKNLGIGQALKLGYKNARFDYVCAIPGDGQFDVNELNSIPDFDENTIVSFYRTEKNYTIYRSILSFGNRIYNYVFLNLDLKDVNWIKIYRKNKLDQINITLSSSLVETEICAKLAANKCNFIELPSAYLPRQGGVPRGGSWKTLKKALSELLLLRRLIEI